MSPHASFVHADSPEYGGMTPLLKSVQHWFTHCPPSPDEAQLLAQVSRPMHCGLP
jgi:hypothetical protein